MRPARTGRLPAALLPALLVTAALAACSGGDPTPGGSSSSVVVTAPAGPGSTVVTTTSPGSTTVTTTTTTGSGATDAPPAPASPVKDYAVAADGVTTVEMNGVRLRLDADVPERAGSVTVNSGGDNQTVLTLRGWSIVVSAGRVTVGGHDFGAVPTGAEVRIAKDGVHVAGEHRGALP